MVDQPIARNRPVAAAGLLLLGHLVASGLLAWATAGVHGRVRAPGPASVDALLALAAAAGAWVALTWLTALTVLTVLTAAVAGLGSRAHRRVAALTPRLCRRLRRRAAGPGRRRRPAVRGAAGRGGPHGRGRGRWRHPPPVCRRATARRCRSAMRWTGRPPASARLDPGPPAAPPRQDAGSGSLVRLVASTPAVGRAVVDEVVVRRGDTLWDIAARHLGPDASAAEIATEWPRWHAANATVIGPDPDLMLPGQRLLPPRP